MAKRTQRPKATHPISATERALFERIAASFAWSAMAALFGFLAWNWPLSSLSVELGNWYVARDYQPIPAKAVERIGKDADGSFKWFAARYEVAGKSFETGRMSLLEDEAIDVPANAVVMKKLETAATLNQSVTVWVSPRDPSVAVVSRDLSAYSVWKRALFGGAFALIALGGTAGLIGAAFATRHYRNQKMAAPVWMLVAAFWIVVLPLLWAVMDADNEQSAAIGIASALGVLGLVAIAYAFYCLFRHDSALERSQKAVLK